MSGFASIRRRIRRLVDAWTGFWFSPLDPLSLGVCRVLVGSMMLYSHLVWGLNLQGFFGPEGWHSVEAMEAFFADDWMPSLWWYVPVEHLRAAHLLFAVPVLMFALGVLTPASSVMALAITISNSNRAPLANYGMDQFLVMLALYLTIGGSGARLSVDAWWRRRSQRSSSQRQQPAATSRARLATRLIQVHYCIIYFFAGISKLQGDAWWNGEAVWMAFANLEYQAIDMTWLARYPWILQIATHATVLWELSFPFVVWNRSLRPLMLAIGIAMHAGIGLCLGMITFGLIAIFGYIAFVPPEVMQRLLDVASRGFAPQLHHPSDEDLARTTGTAVPQTTPDQPASRGHQSRTGKPGDRRVGICDPTWKHRQFAHYLTHRGYAPFVATAPERLWSHIEREQLSGAVLFVDKLGSRDYSLLLDDLTLSPIQHLPLVIASQHSDRLNRAEQLQCSRLRTVTLPAACRAIREALEDVLHRELAPDEQRSLRNGHAAQSRCDSDASPTVRHPAEEHP